MNNFDRYRLATPPSEEDLNECAFCGEPFEGDSDYCSTGCRKADQND